MDPFQEFSFGLVFLVLFLIQPNRPTVLFSGPAEVGDKKEVPS